MKKIILLLTAICSITAVAYSDIEDVKCRYEIKDDKLITYDGKKYPRIHFKDIFHERMAWVLMDPEYADTISKAFHTHLIPTLDQTNIESFGNALVKICQLLCPDLKQSEKALSKALEEENCGYDLWRKKHPMALKNFLAHINFKIDQHLPSEEERVRVLIITTTSSGGNLSVAKSVRDLLNTFPDQYEVTMVDYETFAEIYDPIMIATGIYTKDNIYRMLQQEGFGIEELIEKDEVCYEVAKYIPYHTGEAIKHYVKSLQPDLIISTRNYYADDFNLLSLGIPFRMLNCDHDICFFHEAFVGKIQPEHTKFWLPSASPRFFKQYFIHNDCADLYDETDDWYTLMEKIAKVAHSSFDDISRQFELIGYPVRLEFELIEDTGTLQSIRNRWDLRQDEKAVIVEMGANGGATLEEIFQMLEASPPHNQPIKYYFVCGRNDSMRHALQSKIACNKTKRTALDRCEILGWIEAEDKNELMNICSLMIGKPGGATQAELTCLKLPLFIMDVHEHCEKGNREKLFKSNLAYQYDPMQSLPEQIETTLDKAAQTEVIVNDLDWKENLMQSIKNYSNAIRSASLTSSSVRLVSISSTGAPHSSINATHQFFMG